MRRGNGFAPGKVILLGEHAVVYGRPAIAGSIDRYVSVRVSPAGSEPRGGGVQLFEAARSDARLAAALDQALGESGITAAEVDLTAVTDLPKSVGLGSSASFSVALIRALAAAQARYLSIGELCRRALDLEKIFHGTPSGIDSTVTAMEGLLRFSTVQPPNRLFVRRPIPLVIALGRVPRDTGEVVARVRARRTAEPDTHERIFDAIGELAEQAVGVIRAWDLPALGELMNTNHTLLQRLDVSTPELDEMVQLARARGALGAKLTGGGGGGAIICLCDGDRTALMAALEDAGWLAFEAAVGAEEDHDADDDPDQFTHDGEPSH